MGSTAPSKSNVAKSRPTRAAKVLMSCDPAVIKPLGDVARFALNGLARQSAPASSDGQVGEHDRPPHGPLEPA